MGLQVIGARTFDHVEAEEHSMLLWLAAGGTVVNHALSLHTWLFTP